MILNISELTLSENVCFQDELSLPVSAEEFCNESAKCFFGNLIHLVDFQPILTREIFDFLFDFQLTKQAPLERGLH